MYVGSALWDVPAGLDSIMPPLCEYIGAFGSSLDVPNCFGLGSKIELGRSSRALEIKVGRTGSRRESRVSLPSGHQGSVPPAAQRGVFLPSTTHPRVWPRGTDFSYLHSAVISNVDHPLGSPSLGSSSSSWRAKGPHIFVQSGTIGQSPRPYVPRSRAQIFFASEIFW
jgi:hypothetical protein